LRRQTDSGWLASTPKKLSARSRPRGESLRAREPALGKFLPGIRHVLAAEHAEAQHLLRRELGLNSGSKLRPTAAVRS
jgi:hypothetical protein